jgi:WD40 repeat protein
MGTSLMADAIKLWNLQALPGSRGLELRRNASWYGSVAAFHPGSQWLVASHSSVKGAWDQVTFWPLPQRPLSVIEGYSDFQRPLAISPDSQWLVSAWPNGSLRLWPLPGSSQRKVRVLGGEGELGGSIGLTFDGSGQLLAGTGTPGVFIVSLQDGSVRRLEGFSGEHLVKRGAAFSPSGRLFAAGSGFAPPGLEKELRIWDLETGESRVFGLDQTRIPRGGGNDDAQWDTRLVAAIENLAFSDESTLYSAGHEGLLRWNLEDGSWERLVTVEFGHRVWSQMSDDRQQLITWVLPPADQCGPGVLMPVALHDLRTGATQNLAMAMNCSDWPLAFDGSLSVYVTGGADGTLRVGRVEGGEPHLLTGHRGGIDTLVISPDLEWIASTGEDKTIRVWPMPDLSKPPIHTLPHEELIAKLQSFTNLRAVRDETASTGWSIEIGPFPGWAEVPEW